MNILSNIKNEFDFINQETYPTNLAMFNADILFGLNLPNKIFLKRFKKFIQTYGVPDWIARDGKSFLDVLINNLLKLSQKYQKDGVKIKIENPILQTTKNPFRPDKFNDMPTLNQSLKNESDWINKKDKETLLMYMKCWLYIYSYESKSNILLNIFSFNKMKNGMFFRKQLSDEQINLIHRYVLENIDYNIVQRFFLKRILFKKHKKQ